MKNLCKLIEELKEEAPFTITIEDFLIPSELVLVQKMLSKFPEMTRDQAIDFVLMHTMNKKDYFNFLKEFRINEKRRKN